MLLGDMYLHKAVFYKYFCLILQTMFKLVAILFTIKLNARNDISKYIKKKHGQDIITVIRSLEKLQAKFMKVSADVRYIKTCKKERLIPTFVRVNVSLKDFSFKLGKKIATLIMEAEIQNKYSEKRELRKEIRKIRTTLKRGLNLIILNTVFHQLNVALKSKFKVVTSRHQKKLSNLRKHQTAKTTESKPHYIKNTVQNFSSHQLSTDEYTASSYGLDHHISY